MKHVKSTDPRKKQIVAALKAKSGGSKITCVTEMADGSFQGNAMTMRKGAQTTFLGLHRVTKEEAGL